MADKTGSEELAERVKGLRKIKNFTQLDLAEKSGVAASTIQKIETAQIWGRKDTHERLAKALGVSFSYFISGREDKPKSRIPDLPPDEPPLTEGEIAAMNDPRLGGIFYSKPMMSRLSNAQLRQIAMNALSILDEIERREQEGK